MAPIKRTNQVEYRLRVDDSSFQIIMTQHQNLLFTLNITSKPALCKYKHHKEFAKYTDCNLKVNKLIFLSNPSIKYFPQRVSNKLNFTELPLNILHSIYSPTVTLHSHNSISNKLHSLHSLLDKLPSTVLSLSSNSFTERLKLCLTRHPSFILSHTLEKKS